MGEDKKEEAASEEPKAEKSAAGDAETKLVGDSEEKAQADEGNLVGDSEEKTAKESKAAKESRTFTRRNLVTGIAAGVVGGAIAGSGITFGIQNAGEYDSSPSGRAYDRVDLTRSVPYYDQDHPCGIATMQQRYCTFAMFNMNAGTTRQDLQLLLARWTAAISIMQEGKPLGDIRPSFSGSSVPKDVGECFEIPPSSLTVTVGFGEKLFDDRFGISSFKPEKLVEFPRITNERLDPAQQGSDLGVQICADDSQVIFHALRTLAKIGRNKATISFMENGFQPTRQSTQQTTPRDLFGFRDGSTNPVEDKEFDSFIWVSGGDQEWLEGGSYMVYRRSAIIMAPWENMRISEQERLIGRRKDTGAPLSNPDGDEFTLPDLTAKDDNGNYLIDPNSHVAVTSDQRHGFKILRRAFNYWEGLTDHGDQNCGFLNMSFVNDPYNYWKLRDDMGKYDILNEYYYDDRSGLYAVPQSPATGHYIGQEFFE